MLPGAPSSHLPADPLTLICDGAWARGREITGLRPVAAGAASAHSGSSNMRAARAGSGSPRCSPREKRGSGSESVQVRRAPETKE